MTKTVYLVIGADGEMRLTKRHRPTLGEIAYRVTVNMPKNWGMIAGDITIDLPAFEYDPNVELVPSEAKQQEERASA